MSDQRFTCENVSTNIYRVYDLRTRNSFLFSVKMDKARLMHASVRTDEWDIKDATRFLLAFIWSYSFNPVYESDTKRVN